MKILVFLVLLCGIIGGCATSPEGPEEEVSAAQPAVSDTEIVAAVKQALAQDELLSTSDITVTTQQGAVNLAGNVPSVKAYQRAVSVTREVVGPRRPLMSNELQYPPP